MTALDFAKAAGLPIRMSYSIAETALYTGVSEHALQEEIRSGRLRAKTPRGSMRGARVPVAAVDEWMMGEAND